jgi:hypothetical protein
MKRIEKNGQIALKVYGTFNCWHSYENDARNNDRDRTPPQSARKGTLHDKSLISQP